MISQVLRRWLVPAPDSAVADMVRCGKSPWRDAVHLLWSIWIFITPSFAMGYSWRWAGLTLLSYPLFLLLYAKVLLAPRKTASRYAMAMVGLCLVLLPWYPAGLSYFVFGCVMLQTGTRGSVVLYLAQALGLNILLAAAAWWVGYPWQALVWMLPLTLVIGVIVTVERINEHRDAMLRMSQDEIRRLAATGERERIGRDLHDLLGHTLSLITMKLELSRKLLDRDIDAARRELAECERVARKALAEVRSAVTGIRASGLAAELASAKLLLQGSGMTFDYELAATDLPDTTEAELALVLREAVTNIHRHAGASHASADVRSDGSIVALTVEDNGRGGIDRNGNGLNGMRERIAALGGTLEIDSPSKQGTRLRVAVPVTTSTATSAEAAPGERVQGHAA